MKRPPPIGDRCQLARLALASPTLHQGFANLKNGKTCPLSNIVYSHAYREKEIQQHLDEMCHLFYQYKL